MSCEHPNAYYFGDTNPPTYKCPDCGATFIKTRRKFESEGESAADNHQPETDNPYPQDTQEYNWWRDGWYASRYAGYEDLYNCGGY